MTKLEIIKLAIFLHPCPKYNGINFSIRVESHPRGAEYIIFYKFECTIHGYYTIHYHVNLWADLICDFINIDYNNVIVKYG